MRHFPIFLDLRGETVVVSGAGETAVAKLRLILKTEATVRVFGAPVHETVRQWVDSDQITLVERAVNTNDLTDARLVYAANGDDAEDLRVRRLAASVGVLVNVVDNLDASAFITPAIVDRDPVTVAIGTEGTAPVLARKIKADVEAGLPQRLGILARAAAGFRHRVERVLPMGRRRRQFWSRYFGGAGEAVLEAHGERHLHDHLESALRALVREDREPGHVALVGAGPGDPELLTLKARKALDEADVVLYDRLVDPRILELARREAIFIETGKSAGAASWSQDDINAAMIEHARDGHHVVRLKSGDPLVFGRADEEMDALTEAGVSFSVVPGITSAVGAAAQARVSLTRRGRNSSIRLITAHDAEGFAEHEWRHLAEQGTTFAVYMGVRAARFLQGRMLLHGADASLPVTVTENISRPDQIRVDTTLGQLVDAMSDSGVKGPAILLVGLAARDADISTITQSAPLEAAHA